MTYLSSPIMKFRIREFEIQREWKREVRRRLRMKNGDFINFISIFIFFLRILSKVSILSSNSDDFDIVE